MGRGCNAPQSPLMYSISLRLAGAVEAHWRAGGLQRDVGTCVPLPPLRPPEWPPAPEHTTLPVFQHPCLLEQVGGLMWAVRLCCYMAIRSEKKNLAWLTTLRISLQRRGDGLSVLSAAFAAAL